MPPSSPLGSSGVACLHLFGPPTSFWKFTFPPLSIPAYLTSRDLTSSLSSRQPAETTSKMMQYFHTDGGDNILFASWAPTSPAAIGGASIGIIFLAILERLVNGFRGRLEGYWAVNALHKTAERAIQDNTSCNKAESPSVSEGCGPPRLQRKRVVPPFILSHDIPRGIMYMLQATLTYALMLIVMTFNAIYFVSIIVGLSVGEVMFGRWASVSYH